MSPTVFFESLESRQLLANVATGFTDSTVVSGLQRPTQMAFTPDGRILVAQQDGKLLVVKNGALLGTPAINLTVTKAGERGFSGIVTDPDFAANGYIYVYYSRYDNNIPHNRLSRFTMNGDSAASSSEKVLMDLPELQSVYHMGGGLHFGADGKLYVSVGENARGTPAQSMSTVLGKILRINKDGTIPTDNPFYDSTTGINRSIYALGLRNPFTFAIKPGTNELFINDVGENTWEEVNRGGARSNFGWPSSEGPTTIAGFSSPLYSYNHSDGGHAVIGADFYPNGGPYPSTYYGKYIFGDHVSGWIKAMDPSTGAIVATLSKGSIEALTDIDVGPDGSVYYIERTYENPGRIGRIRYTASQTGAPVINQNPQSASVQQGATASFTVQAGGQAPLAYKWQRNQVDIPGATGATYSFTAGSTDSGAKFRAIVTNSLGAATSAEATLTVTAANSAPVPTINNPLASLKYKAGDVISFSGGATDPQDGTLPAGKLTWRVDFQHDTHSHPFMAPTTGISSGTFTIPTDGEVSANTWFKIYLTATDSNGNSSTATREIFPLKGTVNLNASTPGLIVNLDGQPKTTPFSFTGVVNFPRQLSVPTTQVLGSTTYTFTGWSDGLTSPTRTITTPSTAGASFTANFSSSSSTTTVLAPTADAFVRGGGSAGVNFGTSSALQVKTDVSASYSRQALFKFDLAGVATISSAILRIYGKLNTADAKLQLGVYAADDTSWTETGVNWNNKPATTGGAIATVTMTRTTASTKEFDVSAYLKAQKAAGKRYVTLVVKAMNGGAPFATFNSRESGFKPPELRIF